jgi:hypothetical protein
MGPIPTVEDREAFRQECDESDDCVAKRRSKYRLDWSLFSKAMEAVQSNLKKDNACMVEYATRLLTLPYFQMLYST